MKDLKYIIAYLAPMAAFAGVYYGGIWSPAAVYLGFIFIPLLEFFTPNSEKNLTTEEENSKLKNYFFDILLYLNLPILYGLLWFYFSTISQGELTTFEIVGMTMGVGLIAGTIGINVAHELGHRNTWYEQWMSKAMLLSALYMHFFIEHNRGHHKNVATDEDPASARFGENLYAFWVRTTIGSYKHAWKLESDRLTAQNLSFWSIHNEMLRFQIIQVIYLLAIGWLFGWSMIFFAILVAVGGFLQLETVNYIEHYGLRRKRLDNGRYEPVRPRHSWNSNHEVGRIFLYELTRHSDHHFKANRKYQILRHMDESPQLDFGYPTSMIMSLIPPLWFAVMNKKVKQHMS